MLIYALLLKPKTLALSLVFLLQCCQFYFNVLLSNFSQLRQFQKGEILYRVPKLIFKGGAVREKAAHRWWQGGVGPGGGGRWRQRTAGLFLVFCPKRAGDSA